MLCKYQALQDGSQQSLNRPHISKALLLSMESSRRSA